MASASPKTNENISRSAVPTHPRDKAEQADQAYNTPREALSLPRAAFCATAGDAASKAAAAIAIDIAMRIWKAPPC